MLLIRTLPLTVALLVGLAPSALATPLLRLVASDPAPTVGDAFTITLDILGLASPGAPSLAAYDVDVNFDPLKFTLLNVAAGDPVLGNQLDPDGFGTVHAFTLAPAGHLNLFELSLASAADLDAAQADAFTLATLSLRVLAGGSSTIDLVLNDLADASGAALFAELGDEGVLSLTAHEATPVPEPATLVLVGAGSAAAAWRRHRPRRRGARDNAPRVQAC